MHAASARWPVPVWELRQAAGRSAPLSGTWPSPSRTTTTPRPTRGRAPRPQLTGGPSASGRGRRAAAACQMPVARVAAGRATACDRVGCVCVCGTRRCQWGEGGGSWPGGSPQRRTSALTAAIAAPSRARPASAASDAPPRRTWLCSAFPAYTICRLRLMKPLGGQGRPGDADRHASSI